MTKLHLAIASSTFAFTVACVDLPDDPAPEPVFPATNAAGANQDSTIPIPPKAPPKPSPPEPDLHPTGIASVFQSTIMKGDGGYRSGVAAMFGSKIGPPPDTCVTTLDGPCVVTLCTSMSNDTSTPPSAGKIMFKLPDRVIEMLPEEAGTYPHLQYEEQLFKPGDKITIAATGDEFPTFVTDVVAPPDLALTYPTLDDVLAMEVIDRTQPYELHWSTVDTPTDPVMVTATFITTKDGAGTMLVCEAKHQAGYLTVPQSAVAKLSDTKGEKAGGMLAVSVSGRKTLKVKNEVMRVEVVSTNHSAVIDPIN